MNKDLQNALESIGNAKTYYYDIEGQQESTIKSVYNVEYQILENNIEHLQQENQKLKKENIIKYEYLIEAQKIKINELEKENQELKEAYKSLNEELHCAFARGIDDARFDILEENEKLKKAIELLNIRLEKLEPHYHFIVCGNIRKLTQQEYELLKEVLGNEN